MKMDVVIPISFYKCKCGVLFSRKCGYENAYICIRVELVQLILANCSNLCQLSSLKPNNRTNIFLRSSNLETIMNISGTLNFLPFHGGLIV
jgi:hypothetical protein